MKRILIIFSLFLLIFVLLCIPYYRFLTGTVLVSPFKLLLPGIGELRKVNGTVGILFLGIAGDTYEGPHLSDSILSLQYDVKENKLLIISLPRDIWSETMKDKINTAYAYGEAKEKGGGIRLAKAEAATVVGHTFQYGAVVDFDKFRHLIDELGGIDVMVRNSFVDNEYPVAGKEDDLCSGDPELKCRYKTVSFKEGLTHLDGERALEYVRSRHSLGPEGNDFARGERQEHVLVAVFHAVAREVKSLDLARIKKVYKLLDETVTRDISNQQIAEIFFNLVKKGKPSVKTVVLPQELFVVPDYSQYEGKYVLIPADGTYDAIHTYIECSSIKDSCPTDTIQ